MNINQARFWMLLSAVLLAPAVNYVDCWAWDSRHGNPTQPTHTLITKWAIDSLKDSAPELETYKEALIDGANAELHELKANMKDITIGAKYGVDIDSKRVEHRGTNEGCDDIQGWWNDCQQAYQAGNRSRAYYFLGIILHMIEDMGVPAHAHKIEHQGNLTEFDNFEFMALSNWKPKFNDINKADPAFAEPWKYYEFSKEWTIEDSPNYTDRDSFSKTWLFASDDEKQLLSNRQGRTCNLVKWTLQSACKALK